MTPRRLIVMRHARAESFAETDHERALTERGTADATAAGRHLAEIGAVPDHALVSSASRAVATWEAVAAGSGATATVVVDESIYNGGTESVVESVRAVPEDAATVILVGHNPTVADLAHTLDDGTGDAAAVGAMLRGYPACAAAVLEVAVPWADLGPGTGRVVDFHVGGT